MMFNEDMHHTNPTEFTSTVHSFGFTSEPITTIPNRTKQLAYEAAATAVASSMDANLQDDDVTGEIVAELRKTAKHFQGWADKFDERV